MRRRLILCLTLASAVARAHVGDDDRLELLAMRATLHPGDASYWRERAAILRRMGRDEDAEEALRRAEAVGPAPREHWLERALVERRRDPARALDDLGVFFDSGPPTKAAAVARAETLAALGRDDEAADTYELAFAMSPDPDVAVALAELCVRAGSLDRAALAHDWAIETLGSAPSVTESVATALLSSGRAATARDVTARALSHGFDPSIKLLHAQALDQLGQTTDAEIARRDVLASVDRTIAHRDSALLRLLRARTLAALGRRDDARREVTRVARAHPDLTSATTLLADLREH